MAEAGSRRVYRKLKEPCNCLKDIPVNNLTKHRRTCPDSIAAEADRQANKDVNQLNPDQDAQPEPRRPPQASRSARVSRAEPEASEGLPARSVIVKPTKVARQPG